MLSDGLFCYQPPASPLPVQVIFISCLVAGGSLWKRFSRKAGVCLGPAQLAGSDGPGILKPGSSYEWETNLPGAQIKPLLLASPPQVSTPVLGGSCSPHNSSSCAASCPLALPLASAHLAGLPRQTATSHLQYFNLHL